MTKSFLARAIHAAVLVLGISAAAKAQTPANVRPQAPPAIPQTVDQTQPLTLLNEAKQILETVPDTVADPPALANLRRDFATLQAMYLAQTSSSPSTAAGGSSRTGITTGASTGVVGAAGGAGSQPVGTSGSLPLVAPADWRTQYALVSSDIAALDAAGNINPRSDALRTSLEQLRSRLEKFFTSTISQTASPPGSTIAAPQPSPQAATSPKPDAETRANSEALALLQRMEALLNRNIDNKGDSLKESGLVKMDRADVDEIKAEIADLKAMLRR
jgi:hypothetical protein